MSVCDLGLRPKEMADKLVWLVQQSDLENFKPEQLAEFVNKFNPVIGRINFQGVAVQVDCRELLEPQQLARIIVEQAAQYISANLTDFKPQQLADLVDGFNKTGKKVGGFNRAGEKIEFRWNLRFIDNIVVHFSQCKLEDLGASQLAERRANLITDYILQRNLADFESLQLVELADGLSKVVEIPNFDCEPVFRVMDLITVQLFQCNLTMLESRRLVEIFSKVLKKLDCEDCKEGSVEFESAPPSDLAKVPIASYILYRNLAKDILDLKKFESRQWVDFVINLSQVAGMPSCKRGFVFMNGLAELVLKHKLSKFEPGQLANLVSSFSQTAGRPGCEKGLDVLNGLAKSILKRKLSEFKPGQLVTVIEGLGRVAGMFSCKPVSRAMEYIAEYILQHDLTSFEPQRLVNLFNRLLQASTKMGCQDLFVVMDRIVVHLARHDLTDYKPKLLAELVTGLREVVGIKNPMFLMGPGSCFVESGTARSSFEHLESQELVSLTMGYVVGYALQRNLANFKPQQLADLVDNFNQVIKKIGRGRGYGTRAMDCLVFYLLQYELECFDPPKTAQPGRHFIAEYILLRGDFLDFSSLQLSTIAVGLSKVVKIPKFNSSQVLAALDHLAVELLQRNLADIDAQTLDNMVNGFLGVLELAVHREEPVETAGLTEEDKKRAKEQAGARAKEQIATYILNRNSLRYTFHVENRNPALDVLHNNLSKESEWQPLIHLVVDLSQVVTGSTCPNALTIVNELSKSLLDPIFKNCDPQQLTDLVKGLSQVITVYGYSCKNVIAAMARIANYILHHSLTKFTSDQLDDLDKGFSQGVERPGCKKVFTEAIAYIAKRTKRTKRTERDSADIGVSQLASSVNGFSETMGRVGVKFKRMRKAVSHIVKHKPSGCPPLRGSTFN